MVYLPLWKIWVRQIGSSSQLLGKIKHVPNHQSVMELCLPTERFRTGAPPCTMFPLRLVKSFYPLVISSMAGCKSLHVVRCFYPWNLHETWGISNCHVWLRVAIFFLYRPHHFHWKPRMDWQGICTYLGPLRGCLISFCLRPNIQGMGFFPLL